MSHARSINGFYLELGWSVLPVVNKEPVPINGYKGASTDPAQIEKWWEQNPSADVALPMRPNGLIAIDVDPRNGGRETFVALEAKYGALPRTMEQETKSLGFHLVFRDPGPEGPMRANFNHVGLGAGIDIKCNGYIVVQPSEGYAWKAFPLDDNDEPQIPLLPDAWIPLVRSENASAEGPVDAPDWRSQVWRLEPAQRAVLQTGLSKLEQGKGTGATYKAIKLTFFDWGLGTEGDGWDVIREWNTRFNERDLQRQVERIAKEVGRLVAAGDIASRRGHAHPAEVKALEDWNPFPPADPFAAAEIGWAEQLEQAAKDIANALGGEKQTTRYAEFLFEPLEDLFDRKWPETPWLVGDGKGGLITEGGIAVISTEPKSGKTWAGTEIAIAIATGTKAFGVFPTKAAPGAYFYSEDMGEQIHSRSRGLLKGRGLGQVDLRLAREVGGGLHVQPRGKNIDLCNDNDLAWLLANCRRIGPIKFLVLDPLRDIHTGEEDKSDSMSNVMRRLRVLQMLLGCTVIVVHHATKASADGAKRRQGQKMRGSSAIHGAIDSGIYLSGLSGDGQKTFVNQVTSEVKGARSAGHFALTLTVEDDHFGRAVNATWQVEWATAEPKGPEVEQTTIDERAASVLLLLNTAGGEASVQSLRNRLGMSGEAIKKTVAELELKRRVKVFTKRDAETGGRGSWVSLTGKAPAPETTPSPWERKGKKS